MQYLPARVDESRFVTDSSPNILRKMVRSWLWHEQTPVLRGRAGLPLVEEKETAKLFPASNRARDVRDRLLAFAVRRGVTLLTRTRVTGFAPPRPAGG